MFTFLKILTPPNFFFFWQAWKIRIYVCPHKLFKCTAIDIPCFETVKLAHTQSWPLSDYTNNQRSCYSTASTGHAWLSACNTHFKFTLHWVLSHVSCGKKAQQHAPFIAFATISNRLQVLYVLSILDHKSRLGRVKFNQ